MNRPMSIPTRHRQHGAALVVVLVLLLVMTLLGLASLRGTLMEERMSANLLDRSYSFQAVEAALREGEVLASIKPTPPANGCNADGVCSTPDPAQTDRWKDANFAGWRDATVNMGSLTAVPQFFVEYMGEAPSWPKCDSEVPMHASCLKTRYRITARSNQPDRAQVVLQSTYAGS
jgi:type IV pilus assembly protein PilX